MNITTTRIDKSVKAILDRYKNPKKYKKSVLKSEHRVAVQNESLKKSTTLCSSVGTPTDLSNEHQVTNAETLKKQLGDQFTNINVMRAASCSIGTVFTQLPLGSLSLQESVNEYITNPRQVGSESVFGYALLSGFGEASDMMIAKTPRRGKGTDLDHELFIALNGTNKMRAMSVPNFAIVYGGSKCSKAIIDPVTKKVVNWCSQSVDGSVPYALYENISPGVSAADYTKTANSNRIVSMFVQFVLAETVAYEKIGFTHFDAHNDNVIMRDASAVVKSNVYQVKYDISGISVPVYVKMDAVATFIDYGLSCIRYGNEYIGTTDPATERTLVYSDRAYPLHDVYKFLMFTLRTLLITRQKAHEVAFRWLSKMVMFFNKTETVETIVNKQWNYRYSLPYVATHNIHQFVKFMLENLGVFGDIVSLRQGHKNTPMLQCEKCWTFAGLQRQLNKGEPSSLIELRDADIRDYGNIRTLRNKHIGIMKGIVTRAEDLVAGRNTEITTTTAAPVTSGPIRYNSEFQSIPLPKGYQEPKYPPNRTPPPLIQKLMDNRIKIFTLLALIDRASLYITVGEWVIEYYQDEPLLTALRSTIPRVQALREDLCMLIREYETQISIIDEEEDEWLSSPEARDVFLIKSCRSMINESTKEGMIDDPEKSSWYILGAEESLQPLRIRQDSRALLPRDIGI